MLQLKQCARKLNLDLNEAKFGFQQPFCPLIKLSDASGWLSLPLIFLPVPTSYQPDGEFEQVPLCRELAAQGLFSVCLISFPLLLLMHRSPICTYWNTVRADGKKNKKYFKNPPATYKGHLKLIVRGGVEFLNVFRRREMCGGCSLCCGSNNGDGKRSFTRRAKRNTAALIGNIIEGKKGKKEEPLVSDCKNRTAELYLYDFLE